MARRTPSVPIDIDTWIALSSDAATAERIKADAYSLAYGSLRTHFAALTSVKWDDAVLGLHVVYGWMPTIPDLRGIMVWDQQRKDNLTDVLTIVIRGGVPGENELREVIAFCNNSMVGASKLLHFLNPALLPIWDTRVAKGFLNRSKIYAHHVNSIETWRVYQATLQNWLSDTRVTQRCNDLRKLAPHLRPVTDLRLVELVLFHNTTSRRRARKV